MLTIQIRLLLLLLALTAFGLTIALAQTPPPAAEPTAPEQPTNTARPPQPTNTEEPTDTKVPTTGTPTPTTTEPAGPPAPSTPTLTATPIASGTPPPFGVHLVSNSITSPAWSQLARGAGVRWTYLAVSWKDAYASQPPTVGGAFRSPLQYSALDNVLAAGFIPLVGISGTPDAWLLDPSNKNGPIQPQYYNEFGRFLTALVNQYKDQVKYWEINFGSFEFDAYVHWGCYAKEYADVMKVAGPAIHAADPSTIVVLGPIAYSWWNSTTYNAQCGDPGAVFNTAFLDTVVQEGAVPYFDAISFNAYPRLYGIGPDKTWTTGPGKAKALRDNLPAGQQNKRFLISEVGEPYAGTVAGNGPSTASPEMSARTVTQTYAQVLSGSDPAYGVSGVQIDAALWFTLDSYNAANDWYYGLVDNNTTLNTLPGYDAYKTATAELAGATFRELFNQAGVEGYVFDLPGGATKTVVWATPWYTDSAITVTLPGTGLRIVDKLGTPVAGTVAGDQTQVQVTGSPIYIEWLLMPTPTPSRGVPTPTPTAAKARHYMITVFPVFVQWP